MPNLPAVPITRAAFYGIADRLDGENLPHLCYEDYGGPHTLVLEGTVLAGVMGGTLKITAAAVTLVEEAAASGLSVKLHLGQPGSRPRASVEMLPAGAGS